LEPACNSHAVLDSRSIQSIRPYASIRSTYCQPTTNKTSSTHSHTHTHTQRHRGTRHATRAHAYSSQHSNVFFLSFSVCLLSFLLSCRVSAATHPSIHSSSRPSSQSVRHASQPCSPTNEINESHCAATVQASEAGGRAGRARIQSNVNRNPSLSPSGKKIHRRGVQSVNQSSKPCKIDSDTFVVVKSAKPSITAGRQGDIGVREVRWTDGKNQ